MPVNTPRTSWSLGKEAFLNTELPVAYMKDNYMDGHKKSEPSSVAGGRDGVVARRNHIRSLSAALQDYRIVQDSIDLAWLVI